MVKLIEKSDTSSYEVLNNAFYKLIYTYFYVLCLIEAKAAIQII